MLTLAPSEITSFFSTHFSHFDEGTLCGNGRICKVVKIYKHNYLILFRNFSNGKGSLDIVPSSLLFQIVINSFCHIRYVSCDLPQFEDHIIKILGNSNKGYEYDTEYSRRHPYELK